MAGRMIQIDDTAPTEANNKKIAWQTCAQPSTLQTTNSAQLKEKGAYRMVCS